MSFNNLFKTFKPFFYYLVFTILQALLVTYQLNIVSSTEVTINILIINIIMNILLYVYAIFCCTIEN